MLVEVWPSHFCLLTSLHSDVSKTLTQTPPLRLLCDILSAWTVPSAGGWGTGGVTPCGFSSWLPHWASLFPPCCCLMLAPAALTSAKRTLGTPESWEEHHILPLILLWHDKQIHFLLYFSFFISLGNVTIVSLDFLSMGLKQMPHNFENQC